MNGKSNVATNNSIRKASLLRRIWQARIIYLLLLPSCLFYIIFKYVPMYGIQLAFKKYVMNLGITGSNWVGLSNFRLLFSDTSFWLAIKNTLILGYMQILFFFPFPIVLALILNEIKFPKFKRVAQTIYTFPHFLSWIIIAGIAFNLFSQTGAVNNLLNVLGNERISFLTNKGMFRQFLVATLTWKQAGWNCIMYLAAITVIDPTLYEAAMIDGANRWHRMLHITLPGISMIIIVMLILRVGYIMDAGFDQVINMYNATVFDVSDILDTYIYRISFQSASNYGVSTAAGLFKGLTNCIMLLSMNSICKRLTGTGIV